MAGTGYEIAVLSGLDDLSYDWGTGIADLLTGGTYSASKWLAKKAGGKVGSLFGVLLTGMPVYEIGNFVDDPGWKNGTKVVYSIMGGMPNSLMPEAAKKYAAGIAIGVVYSYYTGDVAGGAILAIGSTEGFKNLEQGKWKTVGLGFLNTAKELGKNKAALGAFAKTKWGGKAKDYFNQLSDDKQKMIAGAGKGAVGLVLQQLGIADSGSGNAVGGGIAPPAVTPGAVPPPAFQVPPSESAPIPWAKVGLALAGVAALGGGVYWYMNRRPSHV